MRSREPVRVPAGELDCYRVHMRVNPAILFPNFPAFLQGFVRFFVPTQTLGSPLVSPRRW